MDIAVAGYREQPDVRRSMRVEGCDVMGERCGVTKIETEARSITNKAYRRHQ